MATAAGALGKLRREPQSFLENYYVMVERAMHQNGPTAYWFGGTGYEAAPGQVVYDRTARRGRILGRLRMHQSKNFKFAPRPGPLVGTTANVMAWHVDVAQSAATPMGAIPPLAVSRTGGPDLMVTTLLNGCTFVCQGTANSVLMAHIQPTGGTSAAQLETDVINRGAFVGGGGGITAFGGGRCYTPTENDVTIVGVRQAQQWRVFAQVHPRNVRSINHVVEFFSG